MRLLCLLANRDEAQAYARRKYFGEEIQSAQGIPAERMVDLQLAMLTRPETIMEDGRLVELPLEHRFLPGLYLRKLTGLAGSLAVTEVHRTDHPFFMLSGHITVKDVATGAVHDLVGPCAGVTAAGTQRIVYAHEETVFVTIHANPDDEHDVALLEERLIERRELPSGRTINELFREQLRLLEVHR